MPLRPPAGFISANYDPLKVANAPTIGTATGGDAQASVAFTAPSNTGGSAITAYYAVSNPSQITASAASSPVTVTGLTNGTAYTFKVWALNSYGPSPYSAASGSVTPEQLQRGLFAGGVPPVGADLNVIEYINIASTGNSLDFGDLAANNNSLAACASSTRGVFGGGYTGGASNVIQYVTIATTGNTTDFGDLLNAVYTLAGLSNSTRGIFGGGTSATNVIQYITIASTGNATDFGDLICSSWIYASSACSSATRGVWGGGNDTSTRVNTIQYVTISSVGNALDFGDLSQARQSLAACSSAHGGL